MALVKAINRNKGTLYLSGRANVKLEEKIPRINKTISLKQSLS